MKYLSLFTGIGGFEKGIEQAYEALRNADRGENRGGKEDQERNEGQGLLSKEGQTARAEEGSTGSDPSDIYDNGALCVGYSEIDRYASSIYQKHFPNHKNYGDITKINEKELPDFDLICGGFPCQSFSIAGKRGGFNDTRGTLFFDICRIIKQKQPRLVLLENVKGLLSHDKGKTFRVIISTLDELGYDIQWQVLNSKNFGVPQNRERVFIVGHLRGTPRPEVFPLREGDSRDNETQGESQSEGERIRGNIASTLAARDYKGGGNLIQLNQPKHSNDRVYDPSGLETTLNTMQGGNRQPFVKISEDMQIRRLTPIECERLQGFPDNWTVEGVGACSTPTSCPKFSKAMCQGQHVVEISDTQRYKCIGNAVTVNVIEAIISKLNI